MDKTYKCKTASPRTKGHGTPDAEAIARCLENFSYRPKSKTTILAKYENLRKCQQ